MKEWLSEPLTNGWMLAFAILIVAFVNGSTTRVLNLVRSIHRMVYRQTYGEYEKE